MRRQVPCSKASSTSLVSAKRCPLAAMIAWNKVDGDAGNCSPKCCRCGYATSILINMKFSPVPQRKLQRSAVKLSALTREHLIDLISMTAAPTSLRGCVQFHSLCRYRGRLSNARFRSLLHGLPLGVLFGCLSDCSGVNHEDLGLTDTENRGRCPCVCQGFIEGSVQIDSLR